MFTAIANFQPRDTRESDRIDETHFRSLKQQFYSITKLNAQFVLPESEKSKVLKNSGEYLSGSNKSELSFQ